MLIHRFCPLTVVLLLTLIPQTIQAENQGDNTIPTGIDTYDHMTVSVHETGSSPSVSGEFLVDHGLASPRNPNRKATANPGYTLYWVIATIDRIETVHVRAPHNIWLHDAQRNSYKADTWNIRGVTFLDVHDPAGGTRIEPGAHLTALFTLPEGTEPVSATLTYGFTKTWEKGVDEDLSEAKLEFDLPDQ